MDNSAHPPETASLPALQLSTAVRDFVAPLERSGSLNNLRTFSPTGSLRQVGAEIHTRIQTANKASIPGYRAEVHVTQAIRLPQGEVVVTGRIDGLYENSQQLLVEEIKSTTNLHGLLHDLLRDPQHPYILQAKMYGWLLSQALAEGDTREIRVKLLLVSVHDPDETLTLDLLPEEHPWHAFENWVFERAQALLVVQKITAAREEVRRAEGAALRFPFAVPRPGQMELVQEVEARIASGERLLLQAPTGLGKTAGVLFPHLRDALLNGKQVFYLTPKNSQHRIAEEAVAHIREQGREVRSVVITAKEKACLKEEVICDPKYCEYALGYYDKLKSSGVLERLAEAGTADAVLLRQMGEEHMVCPFELSLDFTAHADVVICDYNYVFSPSAALQRYFEDETRSHLVNLVVDEAHNLYSRAMDLYSPRIAQSVLQAMREKGMLQLDLLAQESNTDTEKLKKRFGRLVDKTVACLMATAERKVTLEFIKDGAARSSTVVDPVREDFYKVEAAIGRFLTTYAERVELLRPSDPVFELFKLWSEVCGVLRLGGDEFTFTWQELPEDAALQVTCCDASRFLKSRIASLGAATLFSATLKPFEFYGQMSGLDRVNTVVREFASPFPNANRKVLLVPQISTSYKDRDKNYAKVAEIIERLLPLHRGNYFVFFPSFVFLAEVDRLLKLPGFRKFTQTKGMSTKDAHDLLAKFRQKTKNVVVLAVQGGTLAEGIDLPGRDLEGAIVVGPSLPAFDLERECIRAYFDKKYGRGFDYAYVYPAMTRVVQAAGRVIRTPEDKGLLVLADKRFLHRSYLEVMPREWLEAGVESLISRALLKDVGAFWDGAAETSGVSEFSPETSVEG